jgi:hypothetical protein
MPIYTSQHTLGTATPVQIAGSHYMAQDVTIHNMNKTSNHFAYVGGGTSVSVDNSLHIDPSGTLQIKLQPGDVLYAVASHQDLKVGVIQSLQGG